MLFVAMDLSSAKALGTKPAMVIVPILVMIQILAPSIQ